MGVPLGTQEVVILSANQQFFPLIIDKNLLFHFEEMM